MFGLVIVYHTVYVAAAYAEAGTPPCSVIFARIQFFQCALALSCVFRAPGAHSAADPLMCGTQWQEPQASKDEADNIF